MKIASYNISGGFYIGNEDTEYLDREAVDNVDNNLLNQIIDTINNEDIDVICFQEIITTDSVGYIKKIVDDTNLKYYKEFELSPCNIVKNTNCGVAILSKYEIVDFVTELFPNPKLAKTTSSGNTYYTFDKGMLCCTLNVDGKLVKVLTHHGFPYRRFNSSAEENTKVFDYFDEFIKLNKPDYITGDFNTEIFMDLMEYTNDNYIKLFNDVTTVDNCKFDNILVKDKNYDTKIVKLLSDHYMIIVEKN